MHLRKAIPVCLAAMVGFLLGAMFVRQTPVKAQSGLQVYVEHREATIMSMGPTTIPAKAIVGFSCVPDRDKIFTDCYTAYVK
jgi:hypothetical protein